MTDLKDRQFGKLTVVELSSPNKTGNDRYWICKCECGRTNRVRHSHLVLSKITSCGCNQFKCGPNHPSWRGCGEIHGDFWGTIKHGAKSRNFPLEVSIEDIWELFLKQNRKCALSGIDLFFSTKGGKSRKDGNASLDRINSKLGYIHGNVQWVDKYINIMKQNLDDSEFIKYCKLVVENSQKTSIS